MAKKRILYYDLLNICACFGVICMHCNGIAHNYSDTLGWKQAFLVEVLCYWAVPVFFMLSGANLMNYREKYDTKTFFKKRFSRILIPFAAWSVISLVFNCAVGRYSIAETGIKATLENLVCNKIEGVYWFFDPLFSVYLSMPLLSMLTGNKKVLRYAVGTVFVLRCVMPYLSYWTGFFLPTGLKMPAAADYIIYVFLGYLLSTDDFTRKQRVVIYSLGAFGAVFRYGATYYLDKTTGENNKTYFDYFGFFAVFLAVAVFVLFKYINWDRLFKSDYSHELIAKISSCSFGIYLVHMIVLRTAELLPGIPSGGWQWRIFGPIVFYAAALAVVMLLKKIPVLRKIVP